MCFKSVVIGMLLLFGVVHCESAEIIQPTDELSLYRTGKVLGWLGYIAGLKSAPHPKYGYGYGYYYQPWRARVEFESPFYVPLQPPLSSAGWSNFNNLAQKDELNPKDTERSIREDLDENHTNVNEIETLINEESNFSDNNEPNSELRQSDQTSINATTLSIITSTSLNMNLSIFSNSTISNSSQTPDVNLTMNSENTEESTAISTLSTTPIDTSDFIIQSTYATTINQAMNTMPTINHWYYYPMNRLMSLTNGVPVYITTTAPHYNEYESIGKFQPNIPDSYLFNKF